MGGYRAARAADTVPYSQVYPADGADPTREKKKEKRE